MFKKGNENWTTHYLFWSFHDTTNNKQPTKNTKYDIQATTKGIYEIEAKWHLSIFVKLKTYNIAPPVVRYLPFQNLKIKKCRNGRSSI